MEVPLGLDCDKYELCKLNKSVNGLKQVCQTFDRSVFNNQSHNCSSLGKYGVTILSQQTYQPASADADGSEVLSSQRSGSM